MFFTKSIKYGPNGFPSIINYKGFIEESILINHDGSFTTCIYYSGPDMESASDEELDSLSNHINSTFVKLLTGWTINIDLIRVPVSQYPENNNFVQPILKQIEKRRQEFFEGINNNYENINVVSLTFKPNVFEKSRLNHLFLGDKKTNKNEINLDNQLKTFKKEVKEILAKLSNRLSVRQMTSEEMVEFLGYCITGTRITRPIPDPPDHLNYYLGGYDFYAGTAPIIDNKYIYAVTIIGFPTASYSGILNFMSLLPFEYRFSSRFIIKDPYDAVKIIKRIRRGHHNNQFEFKSILAELMNSNQVSSYGNSEATQKALDADSAINEAREGSVKYGYYTSTFIIMDENKSNCYKKAELIRKYLDNNGFPAKIEEINAVDAYLGTLPSQNKNNVRKPLIHTLNLAHIVPITNIWTGLEVNPNPMFERNSSPLFYGKTFGDTPYRFNIHVSDVGHTLIFGPTGSGKSTILSFCIASFFRYKDAQVFVFDKGNSQYALTTACEGSHYNILSDGKELAFCPLDEIDKESELIWASEWLETLISLQGQIITPKIRNDINNALSALRNDSKRTLTNFYTNVQNNEIKQALQPFVTITNGIMSGLIDAEEDGLDIDRLQVFEMENLLNKDYRYSVPILTYLFHKIETRLDGRPTLIVLDEAWLLLKHELFIAKIEEWLRVLRKLNASVIFSTNSVSDIMNSPIKSVINENCFTKIFLPSALAKNPNVKPIYASFGLSEKQISIIAQAEPKRDYYHTSPDGNSLFQLVLDECALSFMGITSKEEFETINKLKNQYKKEWVYFWYKSRNLPELAEEYNKFLEEEVTNEKNV